MLSSATPGSDTVLDLSGTWSLTGGGAPVDCPIPGDVHSALHAAGRIPDPLVGLNEEVVAWVAEDTWTIARTVHVEAADLDGRWPVLDLVFVDTFATLTVNGEAVAELDSCFRRHRIDLSGVLKPGDNDIALRFRPAADEARERARRLPFPIPYSVANNRVPDLNTIRKPQCHGGWDWGPAIMVLGVYEAPVLRLLETARIEHLRFTQEHESVEHDAGSCIVAVDVELAGRTRGPVDVAFELCGHRVEGPVEIGPDLRGHGRFEVTIEDPELWWPAGLGAQPLFDAVVTVPGDRAVRRIGLRSIEVIAEPDAAGTSMVVRVNGRDVFCRGANWIPADSLPSRATEARLARLMDEAVAANMNMLRVWGGGFYESETFYDLCDERGLMVWQDMMFACSQYPSTPAFLAEVDAEVRYQVRRLSHRPSIAIWCGDNEVIGSLTWYELSKQNRDRYLVNYDRLNSTIGRAVTESDPDRRFWPSSPCKGDLDFGDAWHDDGAGDMHYWSVWHENKPFEAYYSVRPRFCSEFGFQAFPTMATIAKFAEPAEWNATSAVMEFHQRDLGGNARIIETMARLFRMPESFPDFVFLSQLQQAMAIDTAVRFWRSLKPHCMGALYWQLNDVWPSVSWSSLDHDLNWKTLHHHARRFFAPVMLAARIDEGRLVVTGVNDEREAVDVEVRVRLFDLAGMVLGEATAAGTLPPDRAVVIDRFDPPAAGRSFAVVDVRRAGAPIWDPRLQSVVLAGPPKRYALPEATVRVEEVGGGGFRFSADRPVLYLRPEAVGFDGRFDDASVVLLPGEPRTLTFKAFDGRLPTAADLTVQGLGPVTIER